MSQKIWLRLNLPEKEFASLQLEFLDCELRMGDDAVIDPQWLSQVDGVFTEENVPDEIIQRMPRLRWLHVTRGGVNAYLTPSVKSRPIQVTGSKGIHGTVFSEFALACIFTLAKKNPRCDRRAVAQAMAKAATGRGCRQDRWHRRTRHRWLGIGAQSQAPGHARVRD